MLVHVQVDELAWLARSLGYAVALKVPCRARADAGSLESGSWAKDLRRRRWVPVKLDYAAWLFPLARPGARFVPSGYHAHRPHGIQDLLLWRADEPELSRLAARMAGDCAEAGVG